MRSFIEVVCLDITNCPAVANTLAICAGFIKRIFLLIFVCN